jgi:plastocyanin
MRFTLSSRLTRTVQPCGRRQIHTLVSAIAVACSVLGTIGCTNDALTRPSVKVNALYSALVLDHHAVTLSITSPYDTVRIVATPENPFGAALPGLGPVTFTSSDLARMRVSEDGVVQALAAGEAIPVVATLRSENLTHVDTVFITVTSDAAPSPLAALSIHPVPPDSAKVGIGFVNKQLLARAVDVASDSMPGLLVDFQSSDPTIATVDRRTGVVTGVRSGRVLIVASATAYGNMRADTLPFTIGLPISATIVVDRASTAGTTPTTIFAPSVVTVGTGATVLWAWRQDIPATDVTFEDSTHVAADTIGIGPLHVGSSGPGNIPAPIGCTAADPPSIFFKCLNSRTFPVPGIYTYHSVLTGAAGQVIVIDEQVAPQGP